MTCLGRRLYSQRSNIMTNTKADGEVNCEISVVRGVRGRDSSSNDDSSNQNECKRVWFKQSVSIQTSPEDINQPAPSKGTSQGKYLEPIRIKLTNIISNTA
jgi:hypothetical protein